MPDKARGGKAIETQTLEGSYRATAGVPVAPGCARRKYPKEEVLTFFKTNAHEFMELGPWSALSAPRAAGRRGILLLALSGPAGVLSAHYPQAVT